MGGIPKGLLTHPDGGTVVDRTLRLVTTLGMSPVLVGENAAYRDLGLEMLADRHERTGPMGGLASLLERAGNQLALALSCDLPYVSDALLLRVVETARLAKEADIIAPERNGQIEPLCAIYRARGVIPVMLAAVAERRYGLRYLADRVRTVRVGLSQEEAALLNDWDSPSDIAD